MDSAVVLFTLAALGHFPLNHLEYFRVDDGFMVILDIVLRDFAFIDLGLLGQEIDGVAFLKERIAFVLLIAEDTFDGGNAPFFLAAGCRDAVFGQCIGDAVRTIYDLQLGQYSGDEGVNPPSRIVIFIDELNKYASKEAPKNSPILRQVLDVAERGRSLGVVLFAAEQFRSAIHERVTGNCSTHAYGRTNSIEVSKSDYKSIPSVYKTMMTRLKQGEYIIQNPVFRSLLSIKFPKPIYKQFK